MLSKCLKCVEESTACSEQEISVSSLVHLLAGLAANPFLLTSLIATYRPGTAVSSRGDVLRASLTHLLDRRPSGPVATEDDVYRVFGAIAYRMLRQGRVGDQASIRRLEPAAAAQAEMLAAAGWLRERDGELYFSHQVVQEFLAAAALRHGYVRCWMPRLLCDKRFVDVLALWSDLDPDGLNRRLFRCLRARNLPLHRHRSRGSGNVPLLVYEPVAGIAATLVVGAWLLDLVLWPVHALASPFGLLPAPPWAVALAVLAFGWVWRSVTYHRGVIVGAASVLSRTRRPETVARLVPALARAFDRLHRALPEQIARFGPGGVRFLPAGFGSRRGRIRLGCAWVLAEIIRAYPTDSLANDVLLALLEADDPQLARPLSTALAASRDPRAGPALAARIAAVCRDPATASSRLRPLVHAGRDTALVADVDVRNLLFQLAGSNQEPATRMSAIALLGALRARETEEVLRAIAEEEEAAGVRVAAVEALGKLQTPVAVRHLVALADADDLELVRAAQDALRMLDDPEALPGLVRAAAHWHWQVRRAAAIALGRIGTPDAVAVLSRLAEDGDPDVQVAAVYALRTADPGSRTRVEVGSASSVRRAGGPGWARLIRHLAAAGWGRLRDGLRLDGILDLYRQERAATRDGHWQAFGSVLARIGTDAELLVRYRVPLLLSVWLFVGSLLVAVVMGYGLARLVLAGAQALLGLWPVAAALVGLALVSLLPGVNRLRSVRAVGALVSLVRWAGTGLIGLAALAAVVYTWWIVALALMATATVAWLWVSLRRSRHRHRLRAAIDQAIPDPPAQTTDFGKVAISVPNGNG